MNGRSIPERPWYPALDGIRGIAILLILLCHNFDFIPFSVYGRTGVDLFFVLSGYLITDILLRTRSDRHYLKNYFVRRALRIFPLYYGFLILFYLGARHLPELTVQLKYYQEHAAFTWLHLQNWLYFLYEKPVHPAPLMNHFWSLSLEEQFYLIWPLVIFVSARAGYLKKLLLLLLFCSILLRLGAWLYWGEGYSFYYFQSVARFDGFAIGGLIAVWRNGNEQYLQKAFRLFIIMAGLYLFTVVIAIAFIPELPVTVICGESFLTAGFGIVVAAGTNQVRAIYLQWLSAPILRWFGKYSYGIYVYHWPVMILVQIFISPMIGSRHFSTGFTTLLLAFLSTAVTLLISTVSYQFMEKRFLRLKTRFVN